MTFKNAADSDLVSSLGCQKQTLLETLTRTPTDLISRRVSLSGLSGLLSRDPFLDDNEQRKPGKRPGEECSVDNELQALPTLLSFLAAVQFKSAFS